MLALNGVNRDTYNFKEHSVDIISALNDYAAAIIDLGLETGFHQHTGTAIMTRDEVYAVMDAVNTKNKKFAPDVGQLQKGGADAAQVVKDYLPLVTHMHLKDYKGWPQYGGYCPLGMGVVDIPAILKMVESKGPSKLSDGGIGSLERWTDDTSRNGQNDQSLSRKDGLRVPHIARSGCRMYPQDAGKG